MDQAIANVVYLVIGGIVGALLTARLLRDRYRAKNVVRDLVVEKVLKEANDAKMLLREANAERDVLRGNLWSMDRRNTKLEDEVNDFACQVIRVEAQLRDATHCRGCSDDLKQHNLCWSCGLKEDAEETISAVA